MDPGETFNQIGITRVDYTPYQDIIDDIIKNKSVYELKPRKKASKLSKEALESLKALGYIQ
jgi:hypothetical protein